MSMKKKVKVQLLGKMSHTHTHKNTRAWEHMEAQSEDQILIQTGNK